MVRRDKKRKETLANKPPIFENLRSPTNALTDWLADWLALQVLTLLINKCVICSQIDDIAQLAMASLFDERDFEEALGKTTGTLPGILLKTELRWYLLVSDLLSVRITLGRKYGLSEEKPLLKSRQARLSFLVGLWFLLWHILKLLLILFSSCFKPQWCWLPAAACHLPSVAKFTQELFCFPPLGALVKMLPDLVT